MHRGSVRPTSCGHKIESPYWSWSRVLQPAVVLFVMVLAYPLRAHEAGDEFKTQDVHFSCPVAEIAGTLLAPGGSTKAPCVVILGGTMSHTRDGQMIREGVPYRDALRRLAETLAAGGYASLRFDKVGYGSSKPTAKWTGSYHDEAEVAATAIRFARSRSEISKVIVAGESAGAYLACLAAKDDTLADAYLFLGGFCGLGEELYEYNFGRLVKYAESRPDRREWAEKNLRAELALGRNYAQMFRAAAEGKPEIEIVDGDYRDKVKLARRQEELKWSPDHMFRYIKAPALALAGEKDLNVPPEHAARAVAIMREAGNQNAASVTILGTDHSFQRVPPDTDEQMRERYTFRSFTRPYEPRVYLEILTWLKKTIPTIAPGVPTTRNSNESAINLRALSQTEIDPMTETTPERIQLAPGLEIIDDIADWSKTAGVETLEGRIGPLLLAEKCQAHFIDMPAGMYLAEHPHSTESITYTVRGKWVLCSRGRRHVMKPGSLYRFGANTPTGYEVPFDEPAYILIFKGERSTVVEKVFIDYLKGMAERLKREQAQGTPFLLKDLPADHPARVFARQANPGWDSRATTSQPATRSTR